MNRREVIAGLSCLAVAGSFARLEAQPASKPHRIAVLHTSALLDDMREDSAHPGYSAFFKQLRRLGYVEGKNLLVTRHAGQGMSERYDELARSVARSEPDLIFAAGLRVLVPLKEATATIPIVCLTNDPVTFGFAKSLARPGGNITGSSVDAGIEILSKRLELLRELAPGISRVALLAARDTRNSIYVGEFQQAIARGGFTLLDDALGSEISDAEYRRAFAALRANGAHAIFVAEAPENYTHRATIVELAAAVQLPAVYPLREFVKLGGLIAYGADPTDYYRRAADQIDQVLRGTKAGDIPFYQPTKFELVINLKTAKALGLIVPPALLARADEVIE